MTEINGVQLPFLPIGGLDELKSRSKTSESNENSFKFDEIFQKELEEVKFSAHAQGRLVSRDIKLNDSDVQRLSNAFKQAEEKGANESLILLDDKAFIVSVPNRTVITVVDRSQMQSNVITEIDSAVIA